MAGNTAGPCIKNSLFQIESKGPLTRSDFKDPILGSENWKQAFIRSDFKVPLLWSFKVCSHDPIFRTDKESSIWHQNDHRDIMQNLSASFIFQEKCQMKIEHVLFYIRFFKFRIPVSEGYF